MNPPDDPDKYPEKDPEKDPDKKPRRRSRGSLSREEILQAALSILQEEGLEKLSMRRIAARLSCSVASPYAHFSSQEEIITSLIVHGERKLTSDLKVARASSDDVFGQLRAIAQAYWSFACDNRELHKLMFNMGVMYRKVFTSLPTSYRVFLETIRKGTVSGAIPFEVKRYPSIARTMWSWMYGLILLEMTGMLKLRHGEDPIEEGIQLFTKMLRRGDDEPES